ncbi:hypothetical protein KPH14_004714 [Odynerus spinipes]|uniref:C2H2-type domain-containing protein n=1 Tax=Odynerus spinipes TaxID=1348599 RepID=A0AAD9RMT3_9HYME|nr:hypothetical protein KPH14_004714 [Odynerus spinipes]
MTTSSCEAEKYSDSLVDQNSNVQSKASKISLSDPLEEWELTDVRDIEFNRIFEKMETLIAEWIQETSCRLSRVSVTNDISDNDNKKLPAVSTTEPEKIKTPECLLYLGLAPRSDDEEEDEYQPVKEISDLGADLESSGRKRRRRSIFDNTEYKTRDRKREKREKKRARRRETECKDPNDELQFTKPRVYECDCCFKIFFHKVFYRRHMIRHIDRNPRCENCNQIFLSKIAKRYHRAQCRR